MPNNFGGLREQPNAREQLAHRFSNGVWRGIVIGKSDEQDVLKVLGTPNEKIAQSGSYVYRGDGRQMVIEFSNGTVDHVTANSEEAKTVLKMYVLVDIVKVLGKPEWVTWSAQEESRTLVWATQGVAATTFINNFEVDSTNNLLRGIDLFPKMDLESYKKKSALLGARADHKPKRYSRRAVGKSGGPVSVGEVFWSDGDAVKKTMVRLAASLFCEDDYGTGKTFKVVCARSFIREMTRLAITHNAINLSQGFPDFDPPREVIDAAHRALDSGSNQYTIALGDTASASGAFCQDETLVRTRLRPRSRHHRYLRRDRSHQRNVHGLLDAGDEVIIIEPYHEGYAPEVIFAGGVPRFVALTEPDYTPDLDQLRKAFNSRTKAIIVNTPHNPTVTSSLAPNSKALPSCAKSSTSSPSPMKFTNILFTMIANISRWQALTAWQIAR